MLRLHKHGHLGRELLLEVGKCLNSTSNGCGDRCPKKARSQQQGEPEPHTTHSEQALREVYGITPADPRELGVHTFGSTAPQSIGVGGAEIAAGAVVLMPFDFPAAAGSKSAVSGQSASCILLAATAAGEWRTGAGRSGDQGINSWASKNSVPSDPGEASSPPTSRACESSFVGHARMVVVVLDRSVAPIAAAAGVVSNISPRW